MAGSNDTGTSTIDNPRDRCSELIYGAAFIADSTKYTFHHQRRNPTNFYVYSVKMVDSTLYQIWSMLLEPWVYLRSFHHRFSIVHGRIDGCSDLFLFS